MQAAAIPSKCTVVSRRQQKSTERRGSRDSRWITPHLTKRLCIPIDLARNNFAHGEGGRIAFVCDTRDRKKQGWTQFKMAAGQHRRWKVRVLIFLESISRQEMLLLLLLKLIVSSRPSFQRVEGCLQELSILGLGAQSLIAGFRQRRISPPSVPAPSKCLHSPGSVVQNMPIMLQAKPPGPPCL